MSKVESESLSNVKSSSKVVAFLVMLSLAFIYISLCIKYN